MIKQNYKNNIKDMEKELQGLAEERPAQVMVGRVITWV